MPPCSFSRISRNVFLFLAGIFIFQERLVTTQECVHLSPIVFQPRCPVTHKHTRFLWFWPMSLGGWPAFPKASAPTGPAAPAGLGWGQAARRRVCAEETGAGPPRARMDRAGLARPGVPRWDSKPAVAEEPDGRITR